MDCIGVHCYPVHCIPNQRIANDRQRARRWSGKTTNKFGVVSLQCGNSANQPEVRTTPTRLARRAELAPPVRAPRTVYVKKVYRVAGQDYCRNHIIRAAVAAGGVAKMKAGAGPVTTVARE